jgi:hypothetical protein
MRHIAVIIATSGALACTIAAHSSAAADYSTPSAALKSLEAAYAAKDMDAAIAARDFDAEAREVMHAMELENPNFQSDADMTKRLRREIEAGFRGEIAAKGFADKSKLKCEFSEQAPKRPGLVPVVESCVGADGAKTEETDYAVKTDAGWKIINLPNTGG